jgi:hypothetical protein
VVPNKKRTAVLVEPYPRWINVSDWKLRILGRRKKNGLLKRTAARVEERQESVAPNLSSILELDG